MPNESTAPVMDVSAPPAQPKPAAPPLAQAPQETDTKTKSDPKSEDKKKATVQSKAEEPKASNGVGMAIFATVVIVLGLAALATYAYLQQK